jgi:hypothetical protein
VLADDIWDFGTPAGSSLTIKRGGEKNCSKRYFGKESRRLRFRNQALDNSKLQDQSAQSLEGGGSGSGRPLELTTADWLEELAVYGTARNLRDQELAYQLSLAIENLYLVHGALRQNP